MCLCLFINFKVIKSSCQVDFGFYFCHLESKSKNYIFVGFPHQVRHLSTDFYVLCNSQDDHVMLRKSFNVAGLEMDIS